MSEIFLRALADRISSEFPGPPKTPSSPKVHQTISDVTRRPEENQDWTASQIEKKTNAAVIVSSPIGLEFELDAAFLASRGFAVGFMDNDGQLIEQQNTFGEKRLFVRDNLPMRIAASISSGRFSGLAIDTRNIAVVEGPLVDSKVRLGGPLFKPTLLKKLGDEMCRRFFRLPAQLENCAPRTAKFENYTITVGGVFEAISGGRWVWLKSGVDVISSMPQFLYDKLSKS